MLKRLAVITCLAVWTASTIATGGGRVAAQQQGSGPPPAANQGGPASPPAEPGQAGAPPAGQDQAPGQPVFRAGINFVRVDVIATDNRGNPILDLKPEDLAVTEDGKPQAIESFKLIKVTDRKDTTPPREIRTSFDEESEAQREDVRLFAIS
jgi:hypothetical protein